MTLENVPQLYSPRHAASPYNARHEALEQPGLVDPAELGNRNEYVLFDEPTQSLASAFAVRAQTLLSERDEAKSIAQASEINKMTGLLTRDAWEAQVIKKLEERRRAATDIGKVMVLILDLDHFKDINDAFGHNAGDEMLAQVGMAIKASLRHGDDLPGQEDLSAEEAPGEELPGRHGGEEFVVFLPYTSQKAAEIVATRLQDQINQLRFPETDGEETTLRGRTTQGASIGIAELELNPDDPQGSLERALYKADIALYSAKKGGRNTIWIAGADAPLPRKKPAAGLVEIET